MAPAIINYINYFSRVW